MGSSPSKAAGAAGGASRKFPSRAPGTAAPAHLKRHAGQAPPSPPGGGASGDVADRALDADAADGDADSASGAFSRRLHSMGVAQPSPTFSASSRAAPAPQAGAATAPPAFAPARGNATLTVLDARRRLELQAARDLERLGRRDSPGRRFLDMRAVIDAVEMRDRGTPGSVIERRLGLERGVMDRLGPHRILSHVAAR